MIKFLCWIWKPLLLTGFNVAKKQKANSFFPLLLLLCLELCFLLPPPPPTQTGTLSLMGKTSDPTSSWARGELGKKMYPFSFCNTLHSLLPRCVLGRLQTTLEALRGGSTWTPNMPPCTLPLGLCSSGRVGAGVQSTAQARTTFLSQDHLVTGQSSGDPANYFFCMGGGIL